MQTWPKETSVVCCPWALSSLDAFHHLTVQAKYQISQRLKVELCLINWTDGMQKIEAEFKFNEKDSEHWSGLDWIWRENCIGLKCQKSWLYSKLAF